MRTPLPSEAPFIQEMDSDDCTCGCIDAVKYYGEAIVTCCKSCPATTTKKKGSCFPGDVQLLLDNGRMVEMKDLSPGHRVLTGNIFIY